MERIGKCKIFLQFVDAILNMELMNGGGCGKIIFGTRHKSTDYWTINVRKFKYNQNQKQKEQNLFLNRLKYKPERWNYEWIRWK